MEKKSTHPVGRFLYEYASKHKTTPLKLYAKSLESFPNGLHASIQSKSDTFECHIGSATFMSQLGISIEKNTQSLSKVYVSIN